MGFFSGLAKPASGVDGFLAALRDKIDRDRLLAAQAIVQGDPAAAMQIRARSQAIDAQRAEAKERARRKRMGEMMEKRALDPAGADPFGGGDDGGGAGLELGPRFALDLPQPGAASIDDAPLHELQTASGWNSGADLPLQAMSHPVGRAGVELRPAAFQTGFPTLADHRFGLEREIRRQAQGVGEEIANAAAQRIAPPADGTVGGRVDIGRPHGGQERAGNRVGSGLGAEIRAAFKPPASPDDPEDGRRILADKLRQIGGLNGVGYIPRSQDYDTLARIIYAESLQHPGDFGAIGWSTINRVGREGFQPTLDEVLHAPNQFAIVSEGNPEGVDTELWLESERPELLRGVNRERWLQARKVAHGILHGQLPDPTGGATRFFASQNYHRGGRAPGDFQSEIDRGRIRPSKYQTTATSGRRQYFFHETAPARPLSRR